jgi:hypothetical protein
VAERSAYRHRSIRRAMRKGWLKLAMITLLIPTSCARQQPTTEDIPDRRIVKRIDRALESFPCVKPLVRWKRTYSYPRNVRAPADIDKSLIFVALEPAEGNSGVRLDPPRQAQSLDHSARRIAWGRYSLASDTFTLEFCGNNEPD